MGCGTSKEDIAKYEALVRERDELALDRDNTLEVLKKYQSETQIKEQKSNEQLNLMRFKIEVLVQMLAMEEKKLDSSVKRLEALKWAMLTQGFSEKTMSNILKTNKELSGSDSEKALLLTSAFDLSGAINRLSEEMKVSRAEIVESFADADGKIIPALSRDEFIRYLYSASEVLTKTDVQVSIALNKLHVCI